MMAESYNKPSRRMYSFYLIIVCFGSIFLLLVSLELQSSGRIIEQTDYKQAPPPNKTKFVFFVGLEGTGHHLIRTIIANSPTAQRLDELGLADDQYYLAKANKHSPLYLPAPWSSLNNDCSSQSYTNNTLFVELMSRINNKTSNSSSSLTVPVNCISRTTMLSYPFNPTRYPCFSIPNIDLFYQTCQQVGVECQHVLLYRDLYSVIASTTVNRNFNSSVRKAIRLYTFVLKYLYTTLWKHSKHLHTCLGILDATTNDTDKVWYPLADMFGYQHTEFDAFLKSEYQTPTPLSRLDRQHLVPFAIKDEMEQLQRIQERLLNLCPNIGINGAQ